APAVGAGALAAGLGPALAGSDLAGPALAASALAGAALASPAPAPPPPSARLRLASPSFLKSVSYQPLPARRNAGAVSLRPAPPSAPQAGHGAGSGSESFCRRSSSWLQAAQRNA